MVAHCVNPSCHATLHSFSEGRLFQFEVVSISVSASDEASAPFDEKPQTQTAHFWLCGSCAAGMSVILEPANGLKLVPLGISGAESTGLTVGDEPRQEVNNC